MRAEELHSYLTVKAVYPNAFVKKETTYGKADYSRLTTQIRQDS